MYKNIYLKFCDLVHMAVKGKVDTYCGKPARTRCFSPFLSARTQKLYFFAIFFSFLPVVNTVGTKGCLGFCYTLFILK